MMGGDRGGAFSPSVRVVGRRRGTSIRARDNDALSFCAPITFPLPSPLLPPFSQREPPSEILYSAPRWPESLPKTYPPARPGRKGTLGGVGVEWAPKPAPTERELLAQLAAVAAASRRAASGVRVADAAPTSPRSPSTRGRSPSPSRHRSPRAGAPSATSSLGASSSSSSSAATPRVQVPQWLLDRQDYSAVMSYSKGLDASGGGGGGPSSSPSSSSSSSSSAEGVAVGEFEMIAACAKPRVSRNAADLLAITRRIRTLRFCASFDAMTLEALSSRVQYEQRGAGEVVCAQGEKGEHFYLVLSGDLVVTVRGLGQVAMLHPGNGFGELALTSAEARQATVRAVGPVSLLTLTRADFQETLAAHQNKSMAATVDFLATMPFFEKWSKNRLARLAMVLTVEYVEPAQEIARQGTLVDRLLFVRAGAYQAVHYSEIFDENRWPVPPEAVAAATAAAATGTAGGGQKGWGAEQQQQPSSPSSSPSPPHSPSSPGAHSRAGGASHHGSPARSPSRRAHAAQPRTPVQTMLSGRRVPSPPRPRTGYGSGSGGTLAYSPVPPVRPRSPPPEGQALLLDTSGHFAMGLRRTKVLHCEPVGEVTPGALYGLPLLARSQAHPFSLIAKQAGVILYLDAKYLRPNALAGQELLPQLRLVAAANEADRLAAGGGSAGVAFADTAHHSGYDEEGVGPDGAGHGLTGPEGGAAGEGMSGSGGGGGGGGAGYPGGGPSSPSRGGDGDQHGLPESRYTQVIKRAAPPRKLAHLTLTAAGVKPKKGPRTGTGQDELGIAFPTSGAPSRSAKPLTTAEVSGVLSHVKHTQDVATDDAEDQAVANLLSSVSGVGVRLYAATAGHLRGIGAGAKHLDLGRRLVQRERRGSLTASLPLDVSDCEKILRRMLTRLDDDNRALGLALQAQQHGEGGVGGGEGEGEGGAHGEHHHERLPLAGPGEFDIPEGGEEGHRLRFGEGDAEGEGGEEGGKDDVGVQGD
jgi:CRP-like cAMP-binding protein